MTAHVHADAQTAIRPPDVLLELEDVSVTYGGSVRALEGLSLTVRTGEVVALLGVNGAGKTTALRAIMGLLPYNGGGREAGTIRFSGQNVNGLERRDGFAVESPW
nr:ATP-binding cassette domain-containing protein [Microbacterium sp. CH12i]